VEPPPYFGRDEAELRSCAAATTDAITDLEVTINGEVVPDAMAYRTTTPLFTMTFPEDNFFGVPAGPALAVADGYSIILAPPAQGEYEIVVSGVYEEGGEPIVGTIQVVVATPHVIEPAATPAATPGS
jgi:hypothetical protein